MRIIITGGGTGGHLIIAKVFAKILKNSGAKVAFIGSTNGQDRAWFEKSELFDERYFLQSGGVVNKSGIAKIYALLNIFKLSLKCTGIFKSFKPDAVISVGGYSASPASFAAILTRVPLFIHEQNALTGKLNRLIKPFAKGFYSSYEELKFSYPVDEKFFDLARDRSELKTVIFLGGSQGASFINSLAISLVSMLTKDGINIIHQCGKKEFESLREIYQKLGISVDLFAFSDEIYTKIAKADICVARSGASSLWELVANRLPAIFIPYPYAANNHQFLNAKFLAGENLAKICLQNEASADKIYTLIKEYDIKSTSKVLKGQISKDGANLIIKDILSKI